MRPEVEVLAEQLVDINAAIESAKSAMRNALGAREYQEALDAKVGFLADRAEIVEKLEALGLDDPDL